MRASPDSAARGTGYLVIAFLCLMGSTAGGATPFFSGTVDAAGFVGRYTSLAFDPKGVPHIAYYDADSANLKHAFRNAGVWTTETVDATIGVGRHTSLAFDAQGVAHISYFDGANVALKYAKQSIGGWTTETVDASICVGGSLGHTGLALDAQGRPHIGYYQACLSDDLKYAVKTGGVWTIETVDSPGDVGAYASLALDAQGVPHISYYDFSNGDLKYAVRSGGAWATQIVDAAGLVGGFTSVAVDGLGSPHVSYFDFSNGDLKYAVKTGGVWTIQTIDNVGDVGEYTSIALDALENPHISYRDATSASLKYAFKSAGFWAFEMVDNAADVGEYTSLALDAQGNPHISYHDITNLDLKYASSSVHLTSPLGGEQWPSSGQAGVTWDGLGSIDIQVSSDGGATYTTLLSNVSGGSATVAVPAWETTDARIRIVRDFPFSTSTSPEVFAIARTPEFPWWTYTIDAKSDVGAHTSLAISELGIPHISYYDVTTQDLRYVIRSGGSWTFETIDSTGNVGAFSSLALDAQGNPRISYYAADKGNLIYAVRSGSLWITEIVDDVGVVGEYSSLSIDVRGDSHVSYYDNTNADLKYAVGGGAIWTTETVDAVGAVGRFTSLSLDALGFPHISYYDGAAGDLKYANKTTGVWVTETIDATGIVGSHTSLAVDAGGSPHISYYDGTNTDLKYAVKAGGVWTIETVDAAGIVGLHTSLSLDAHGNPHISYYDDTNDDLKYAVKRSGTWTVTAVDAVGNVGWYSSLAFDPHDIPHVSYYDPFDGDLEYASAAVEAADPFSGVTWPVGAIRSVTWDGVGAVDLWLSVDGGATYPMMLASEMAGGRRDIIVPHTPSRFCRIKLERRVEANTFGGFYYPHSIAETDSFFTIETSISLLMMMVLAPQTDPGLVVSWETDPGPEDLGGYRLEKRRGEGAWFSLVTRTTETTYHDEEGAPGDHYRLFAINGLGEEFYLGESSDGRVPRIDGRLVAWPTPFSGEDLQIRFGVAVVGGVPQATEVAIYDVAGRRVRKVARIARPSGTTVNLTWDGRDERGRLVPSGIYFIRAMSGQTQQARKFVVVR